MMTPLLASAGGRSVIVPEGRPSPSANGGCVTGTKVVLPSGPTDLEVKTGGGGGVVLGGATGV